jgi:hypothetical protein
MSIHKIELEEIRADENWRELNGEILPNCRGIYFIAYSDSGKKEKLSTKIIYVGISHKENAIISNRLRTFKRDTYRDKINRVSAHIEKQKLVLPDSFKDRGDNFFYTYFEITKPVDMINTSFSEELHVKELEALCFCRDENEGKRFPIFNIVRTKSLRKK